MVKKSLPPPLGKPRTFFLALVGAESVIEFNYEWMYVVLGTLH